MATVDHGSPSQFVGQPWSSWADKVVGTDNKDAPSGRGDEETDGSLEVQDEDADREQDTEQVMKLRLKDANVFGICPTQDEFYLVVCEQCKQVIKPQALERHMELRHGKPPDKPPDITREMEMHSPQILIPTTLRAPLDKPRQSSQNVKSPGVDSELSRTHSMHPLSLRPSASQAQPELAFDTVLTKQLPGHLAKKQDSPIGYTTSTSESDRPNASPTGLIQLNSPLGSQESVASLVSTTLPIVRVEKMSPLHVDSTIQSFGISPTSLASIQPTTIELASAPGRPIQCAPNVLPQQSQTLLQTAKPVQPAMVQLAPVPAGMMQAVKPALVQPPPIQPAPAHTSLLKLAPAHPVPTKKSKKLSPKKNILCKDREYDVNKHCGVWVETDHRQCTRSLTCKTHALSLRRAVKGRRKPFDELLAEHKARSQALAAVNNPSLLKKPGSTTPTPAASGLLSNQATQGNSAARPTTPKVTTPRPNTPKATTPKALTPKPLTPRTQTSSLHVKAEPGVKPQVMFQKIMPVPGPVKTFNLNSVLPTKKPFPSLPKRVASPTPEVPSPQSRPSLPEAAGIGSGSGSSGNVKLGPAEKGAETKDKSDFSCSHHHPRPVAMCSYGARQVGKGLYAFNRRLDHLRSTMAALVEKHTSRPPPLKKMCLSNEPLEDVAMDTSPPSDAPNLQMNNSAPSHPAASTSAFSFSSVSLFDTIPSGSKIPATMCGNGSNNSADSVSRVKSVPNAVQNNFSKGAAKKLSKAASKAPGKSGDGKGLSSIQHPVKNSKARRKSGSGGGGKSNVSVSVAQNLFSVSTASPVTLTPASSAYSIMTNSGLQLSSGVVGLDPSTLSGQELSDSLLKNLRFVVTNIDPNVNGGAATTANSANPQATSNFTVPLLNATIGNALGNTPVLLGNLGALALPYDRKLNVKSRTKSASSGKSAMERQGRRLSGGTTVTGLQNIAIVNQPFVECASQETMGVGGGGGGVGGGNSEGGFTVNMCQSLQSPQSSVPSPQLRPNSASPQLSSPIPNGIIPSPTNITFKPYPGTVIATSTVASANHVQRGMSPSRTSTPSPGTGSTEASPNISAHILPGSFTTSGKLSLVSPKGSSHNLPKSTLNQKHSNAHLHHRSIAQLATQQHLQQQQQQQQQQALQFHQLLTPQQISNLVAQGKPMSLSSALIPGLFQSIPTQPVNPGALQGGLTLAPAVAADQGGKVLSQSAVLPQGAIALHLQQPGAGQPIRLQGGDQSQMGMSQEEDNRQELKMQH
ncbi:uncharacterized protein [Asterias amurensis]|uniref:uncharacterized protein n=1 Tax=Asterias amurensis TaxID=7602 RepID=UPI003AB70710